MNKIEPLFDRVAKSMAAWFEDEAGFKPYVVGDAISERRLLRFIEREVDRRYGDLAIVEPEVPFKKAQQDRFNNEGELDNNTYHLDLYCEFDRSGYLIEAKRFGENKNPFAIVENELLRITSVGLRESFHALAQGRKRKYKTPENMNGLFVADCWQKGQGTHCEVADRWKRKAFEIRCPKLKALCEGHLSTTAIQVKARSFEEFDYYLLIGQIANVWGA